MKDKLYATEDAVWHEVFDVVRESVERDPKLIDALELYLEILREKNARSDDKKRPS